MGAGPWLDGHLGCIGACKHAPYWDFPRSKPALVGILIVCGGSARLVFCWWPFLLSWPSRPCAGPSSFVSNGHAKLAGGRRRPWEPVWLKRRRRPAVVAGAPRPSRETSPARHSLPRQRAADLACPTSTSRPPRRVVIRRTFPDRQEHARTGSCPASTVSRRGLSGSPHHLTLFASRMASTGLRFSQLLP